MAKFQTNNPVLYKVAVILNLIASFFLIISDISCFLSPYSFWLLAFFGLCFPLLLFLNILFIILWITLKKKIFLISLITILLGFNHLTHIYNFSSTKNSNNKDVFKVMSYNIHFFSFFDYKLNDYQHRFTQRNNILALVKSEAPDIICFQEFFFDKYSGFKTLDTLLQIQDAKYFYASYSSDTNKCMFLSGAATFSKYPIINSGVLTFAFSNENRCIYTDIVKGTDTIRVYNVQMESIKLDKEEEDFYTGNNTTNPVGGKSKKGLGSIFSKIKTAFIKRAYQANELSQMIKGCRYHVLVCGDFNDTPTSYTYHVLTGNLSDSFYESGNGLGTTYNGKFPTSRIDYILHDKAMKSLSFKTLNVNNSDHFPIVSNIILNEKR